jgi:hypothetical protein
MFIPDGRISIMKVRSEYNVNGTAWWKKTDRVYCILPFLKRTKDFIFSLIFTIQGFFSKCIIILITLRLYSKRSFTVGGLREMRRQEEVRISEPGRISDALDAGTTMSSHFGLIPDDPWISTLFFQTHDE